MMNSSFTNNTSFLGHDRRIVFATTDASPPSSIEDSPMVSRKLSVTSLDLPNDLSTWDPFDVTGEDDSGGSISLRSDDDFEAEKWDPDTDDEEDEESRLNSLQSVQNSPCDTVGDGDTVSTTTDDSFVSRDSITSKGFRWDKAKLVTMLSTRSLLSETIDEQSELSSAAVSCPPEIQQQQPSVDPKLAERLQTMSREELALRYIKMQQKAAKKKQQEALERSARNAGDRPRRSRRSSSRSRRSSKKKERKTKRRSSEIFVERPDEALSSYHSSAHF